MAAYHCACSALQHGRHCCAPELTRQVQGRPSLLIPRPPLSAMLQQQLHHWGVATPCCTVQCSLLVCIISLVGPRPSCQQQHTAGVPGMQPHSEHCGQIVAPFTSGRARQQQPCTHPGGLALLPATRACGQHDQRRSPGCLHPEAAASCVCPPTTLTGVAQSCLGCPSPPGWA
ncbi:hypothetical protein ANN_00114 [Periplaneta americana]|uniref:Uncharacterized protein n=1 Tax=Periplaneta americana TaxID=6978 RepID=A0ABQ8TPV5_PERAM|nr:hypothetical protein ANN_00114 [Periplaneta americana]